ncbi:MAG: Kelch repeat-containing protein [Limisphaerales bacterium]
MLLLTDGTVLCHDEGAGNGGTSNWWKLTPDSSGSYVNGQWTQVASLPNNNAIPQAQGGPTNAPLYFAAAVLKDGRVFVAGGEYNAGNSVELLAAAIYNPVTNSWTNLATPANWANIGDAPCCVLPDGTVLLGSIEDKRTALYDPVANTWTATANKDDTSSEETWTLLPDGSVLNVECPANPKCEKYLPASDKWVSAGSTPQGAGLVQSSVASSNEIGPAILMTDGRVFAIGATGHTALYTPPVIANQPGTWAAGPDFPKDGNGNLMRAFDAPACLLPNGKVLCMAGPPKNDGWAGPTNFFEFDGASLSAVPNPANAGTDTWQARLLLLPTGEVLFSNGSQDIEVYQPDGAPDPSFKPEITSSPNTVQPGQTYTLKGRQINGLSQANSYGDDATNATNYPLVRIRNLASNHVFYCRTHGHSTMGLATGNVIHSTQFQVPANIELGASMLCVVANGIADCVPVGVSHKIWKELKWEIKEIKEIKENIKAEVDVIKNLAAEIPKLKDAEGDPWQQLGGDPEWMKAIRLLAERSDQLEEQVRKMRAFIREEERPQVGEQALKASAKKKR